MADSTVGQLAPFIPGAGSTAIVGPLRTNPAAYTGLLGARLVGAMTGASGLLSVSGTTKSAGVPVARRVVLMTQPPAARIVAEVMTSSVAGAFSFPNLPAGNYTAIDFTPDGSKQALVYDWVVAG